MAKLTILLTVIVIALVIISSALLLRNNLTTKITGNFIKKANPIIPINSTNVIHNPINYTKTIAKIHHPVKLNSSDVLVSFRIDDITFQKSQKQVLENALYLAHKYNITFDLAVIAQPFDKSADPDTFAIYQQNQDVFEVVAHGLTHKNPVNSTSKGEFYDFINKKPIPTNIQEDHIKNMSLIFKKHNLLQAQKIFILPWHAGDNTTVNLAEKYGYKLIVQVYAFPNKTKVFTYKNIIVSRSMVEIAMNQTLATETINAYDNNFDKLIQENYTRIQIMTHPINYQGIDSIDKAINEIIKNDSKVKPRIKFSFISDGL